MTLGKKDLQAIEKIVTKSEEKINKNINQTKDEVLGTLGKEISDIADINRAVITKTDELDYRLRIVERKLGLGSR